MIERNLSKPLVLKINWEAAKRSSLTLVNTKKVTKDMPGWNFWGDAAYVLKWGNLSTNGMLQKGHRPWKMDGKTGVLVPEEDVTRIHFNEEVAAQITRFHVACVSDASRL